jgi:hypothetical protein
LSLFLSVPSASQEEKDDFQVNKKSWGWVLEIAVEGGCSRLLKGGCEEGGKGSLQGNLPRLYTFLADNLETQTTPRSCEKIGL